MARATGEHASMRRRGPTGRRLLAGVGVVAALVVLALGIGCAPRKPVPRVVSHPAQLVFAEEFDGPPLRADRWAVETPWHTQYTRHELQWYRSENLSFPEPGILRITTSQERVPGTHRSDPAYDYTSAMISTGSRSDAGGTTRVSFRYGYFEMRARLPKGRGVFPAFWLTNDRTSEIDVMEMLGHEPHRVYMTLRGSHGSGRDQQAAFAGEDFSAGYHTFAVDWQAEYVRFYVDGREQAVFIEDVPSDPMWIVANTAVGGAWPGPPDSTTEFPQHFDIDHIRVWRTDPYAR